MWYRQEIAMSKEDEVREAHSLIAVQDFNPIIPERKTSEPFVTAHDFMDAVHEEKKS